MSKTIVELCEPFFEYVCRLNMAQGLSQGAIRIERVQAEIQDIVCRTIGHRFQEAGKSELFRGRGVATTGAAGDSRTAGMEELLICLADNLLANSDYPWAHEWDENRLSLRLYAKRAGDDTFKRRLEECINQVPADRELSEFFYRALGFGFCYPLMQERDVREYVAQLGRTVGAPPVYENPMARPITPEASTADARRLDIRPGVALIKIILALGLCLVVTFVSYWFLWDWNMGMIRKELRLLQEKGREYRAATSTASDASP